MVNGQSKVNGRAKVNGERAVKGGWAVKDGTLTSGIANGSLSKEALARAVKVL